MNLFRRIRASQYASAASTLAVALALTGTAWAATELPPDSVGTPQLQNDAVIGSKVLDGSLSGADLGDLTINRPTATTTQRDAAVFNFGDQRRVAIGQQRTVGYAPSPSAGLVEVRSEEGRVSRFTHYKYGSSVMTTGPLSGLFEFWLGDAGGGQPILSARHNGADLGAMITARNRFDTSGVALDFGWERRPRLKIEDDNQVPGAELAIENPQPDGTIRFATKYNRNTTIGGQMQDQLIISGGGPEGGSLRSWGPVAFGDTADDPVRFHGTNGSGRQGKDPGALRTDLTAADVDTPEELAALLNEQRRATNELRQALLQQGLVGG